MNPRPVRTEVPAPALGAQGGASRWGDNGGPCLEPKNPPGGRVALPQPSAPASPALILEPAEIRAFVQGAKAGLADELLP